MHVSIRDSRGFRTWAWQLAGAAIGVLSIGGPVAAAAAPSAQVPSCVVGSWRAVDLLSSMGPLLEEVGAVEDVTGEILLAVQPDGAYEVKFVEVAMALQTDAGLGSLVLDAVGTGTFRESGAGMLASSGDRFVGSLTVTMGDQTFTHDEDSSDEGAPSPYECAGGGLEIGLETGGDTRAPLRFVRQ